MAEAAGLALGVAGIIASFKGTVDLFNLLADARHLGREYKVLETKLDVEKMLLLRWADGVNLLSDNYDRRLDDTNMQALIVRILSSIAELLTSEPDLRNLYGLAEAPAESSMAVEPDYSERRWDRFRQRYQALSLQVPIRQKTAPIHRRIRWVVRDREKFGKLVGELENFRAKLNDLVPIPNSSSFNRMMDDEDVRSVKDLPKLKLLLEASRGSQSGIAESTQQAITKALEDRVLATLWFRRIDERRESISEAHFQTLQWAFEPPTADYPWDDLVEWLSYESGIYWVSGKAGSGKSTLMKHIYSSQRTHDFLEEWAGEKPLYMGHFFFMSLGTAEQRTQKGLARTLLYQILSYNPSLIPGALPNIWKELQNNMHKDECAIELPSLAEIKYAFKVISNSSEHLGKVCLFVDGLDEFDGDLTAGIAFIKSLTVNSSIKAIISSRPIPACVAAFDGMPTLALHDLNLADIASYVYDTVGSHDYMRTLIARSGEEGDSIITDIIAKSSGVFLWVILACRALLSGFADHDRLPELRQRVDELPPELEDMFQHMLYKINTRHREEGSRLLRICYMHQKAPWPDAAKDIYALGIAMISDDRNDPFQFNRLSDSEKQDLYAEMQGRLRSRCGGLLELHHESPSKIDESIDPAFESNPRPKVLFMHRTVFEFLNDQKVWNLDCLKIPESQFDVSTLLAHYNLHLAIQDPTARGNPLDHSGFAAFIWDGLRWAVQQGSESFFSKLREFLAGENASPCDPTTPSLGGPSRMISAQLFSKELPDRSEMLSLNRTLTTFRNDIAEKWDSETNVVKVGLKRNRDGHPVRLPVACLWCRMMRVRCKVADSLAGCEACTKSKFPCVRSNLLKLNPFDEGLDSAEPQSVEWQSSQQFLGQKGLICHSLLNLSQPNNICPNFPWAGSRKTRTEGLTRQTSSFPAPDVVATDFSTLFNADVVTVLFLGVLLEISAAMEQGDDPFYSPDPELKLFRSSVCRDFLRRVNDIIRSSDRDTHRFQRDASVVFGVLQECKVIYENSGDRRIARLRELATCLDFFNAYWLARSRRRS